VIYNRLEPQKRLFEALTDAKNIRALLDRQTTVRNPTGRSARPFRAQAEAAEDQGRESARCSRSIRRGPGWPTTFHPQHNGMERNEPPSRRHLRDRASKRIRSGSGSSTTISNPAAKVVRGPSAQGLAARAVEPEGACWKPDTWCCGAPVVNEDERRQAPRSNRPIISKSVERRDGAKALNSSYIHLYSRPPRKKLWEALTSSEFSRRYWVGHKGDVGLEGGIAVCARNGEAR